MYFLVKITFLICSVIIIQVKTDYIIDVIDVEWNVTSTNNCDMFWEATQPSRGTFAFNGKWVIKEDVNTENAKINFDIYYSNNAISYMLTPFRISPMVFTESLKVLYPEYLRDTMIKCCENTFEDNFVPPLTKRNIICKNCLLDGSNFPSHLRPGFYQLLAISVGEFAFVIKLTVRIEID